MIIIGSFFTVNGLGLYTMSIINKTDATIEPYLFFILGVSILAITIWAIKED
jgi:hypothetical protein